MQEEAISSPSFPHEHFKCLDQEMTSVTYFGPEVVKQYSEQAEQFKVEEEDSLPKVPFFDSLCEQTKKAIVKQSDSAMMKEEANECKESWTKVGTYSLYEDMILAELNPIKSGNLDQEKLKEVCARLGRPWTSIKRRLKILSKLSLKRLAKLVHIAQWNPEKSKMIRVMVERAKSDSQSLNGQSEFFARLVPYADSTTKNNQNQIFSAEFFIQQFEAKLEANTEKQSEPGNTEICQNEVEEQKASNQLRPDKWLFSTPPRKPQAALSVNRSEFVSESDLEYNKFQESIRHFVTGFALKQLKSPTWASQLLARLFTELNNNLYRREFIDEDENWDQKHASIFLAACTNALMRAEFQSRFIGSEFSALIKHSFLS